MTLLIVGLDALDAGLVEYFDIDSFRLGRHREIETYSHMLDRPYTLEVWPTIATGLSPEEHGVTRGKTSEWNNPLLELATYVTGRLPERTRARLGRIAEEFAGAESSLGRTGAPTIFDEEGRVVHNWPGVTDGTELQRVWDLMASASRGEISRTVFDREILAICGAQFGWAREMLHHDVSVAGVHVHTLDAAGHPYGDNEAKLQQIYERVGGYVEELEAALGPDDDLLVVSDHGMTTSFLDADGEPGVHSWRAFASTTCGSLPASVYDVHDWVEEHAPEAVTITDDHVELSEQKLQDLGYM